jgi:hypothetical protein
MNFETVWDVFVPAQTVQTRHGYVAKATAVRRNVTETHPISKHIFYGYKSPLKRTSLHNTIILNASFTLTMTASRSDSILVMRRHTEHITRLFQREINMKIEVP